MLAIKVLAFFNDQKDIEFGNIERSISINDNGINYKINTSSDTVENFLREKNIALSDRDQIIPTKETKIFSGMNIAIRRAVKIKIEADGKTKENWTLENNVYAALSDSDVILTRLDKTNPEKNYPVFNGMTIAVTRINEEEIIKQEDIDFKTIQRLDSKMGWREKNVTTLGENGIMEVKYKVTYKNGNEISRVVLGKNKTKDPVTQIETQGTYMKLGKANKGQGTWYAYQGGMFAASTTIAKGGFAKVTNTATGKSVVVQINDYGPQGKGRVIDLDKVAFQKIANIGAGVIGVKVEEVLN
ncbi:MAG TPA: G5 domain-containing protein [Patescibacteria group bacterium]|nr:G5 domain-containing protein [Patescibacteria group bacterium]